MRYKFRVDGLGKILYYTGRIVCEDTNFFSVQDQKIGLVRIAKNKIIAQEEVNAEERK